MTDLMQTAGGFVLLYLGGGVLCTTLLLLYGLVRSWRETAPFNCSVLLIACIAVTLLWGPMLLVMVWLGFTTLRRRGWRGVAALIRKPFAA